MRPASMALSGLMLFSALCIAQRINAAPDGAVPSPTEGRATEMNAALEDIVTSHRIMTAGVGIIDDGKLAWSGYFGEESPGEPASAETLFNVASITKVVTSETILRLVAAGKLSLDESISKHWVDPDIRDDPRHEALTPRLVLNHTTGFPNWRFFLDDNKLRFLNDPGTTYGYSGEAFEYLAKFVEKKLGRNFGDVVREVTLEPIGMEDTEYSIRQDAFDRMAVPRGADGTFHGHYCRPNGWCRDAGSYSAADDMVTTVADFARFLTAVVDADGYPEALASERDRVQTPKGDQRSVLCDRVSESLCPEAQGYGLGWDVLDYGDSRLLSHGGSDWAEVALAYIYTGSRDGVVIFLNAPNARAIAAIPDAIGALDPDSPLLDLYRRRAEAARAD